MFDTVADPVDIVTGAFYVDEIDLSLPGPFPLEIRRNYNSQNPLLGIFGFGWKLSLNPYLYEEADKLFVSEQDGTVIVYRRCDSQNRWIIYPEDNPDLCNFIGTSNPYHAYIEKNGEYILHGGDGSKRVFSGKLLKTWSDHAGNTLTFSYEQDLLKRIENSSGGFLCFNYNHSGKISEAYSKDGRRITYTYDIQGNLSTVTLPNEAVVTYEYDRSHRIIRETKPHGRVLENVYRDDKVVEQRSPVGQQQHIVASVSFNFLDGVTTATDAAGGCTEYKIYHKKIYKITDPQGHQTLQSWFLDDHSYFNAETEQVEPWNQPGGYPRSLKSTLDKRRLSTNYLYDSQGNVGEIILRGNDLTGKGENHVSKRFSYNINNLCILEETLTHKTFTTYDATYPYLPKRIEVHSNNILTSFIDLEYTAHGMIKRKNESGAITLFEYDDRDFLIRKIQKTGTDDPDVVTIFSHNNQGQCVEQITADSIQHSDYDIMGNCYHNTISLVSGKIISLTHGGYNLNNELIWKQGDDPNDTLFLEYNASGLLIASRKHLSQFNGSTTEPAGVAYTLYDYDACGRLIEEVDPLGNCQYCDYDALGRLSRSTKHGHSTIYSYEAGGKIASVTTPGRGTTYRSYTTNGLLKSVLYPDKTQISIVYDMMGRPIQETKYGVTSTICYNDETLEEVRIRGEFTEIRQFDARGNLLSYTDRAGFTWTKTYDALNRVKTEISPGGDITKWNYQGDTTICTLPSKEVIVQRFEAGALVESKTLDPSGALISLTRHNKFLSQSMTEEIQGDITTTTWTNTLGLPIYIQQGSCSSTFNYDATGNCMSIEDGEGNITEQKYDPLGRLIEKRLPDGAIITYDYDADSNLIAYHMPGNLTWKAVYDSVGHKLAEWQEMHNEAFQRWEYTYNNGLLMTAKDPMNRIHQYTYDLHTRLAEVQVGDYYRRYTYDPRGLLASVSETGKDSSKVERIYDESRRLIQEIITLNGVVQQHSNQTWTPSSRSLVIGKHKRDMHYQAGRIKNLSSNGLNISYSYELDGSLKNTTTPFSTLDIKYNESGLPRSSNVQLQGKTYQESLEWTPHGKIASLSSSYGQSEKDIFTYSPRGYLKSNQENIYTFDFDQPGRGILTASPNLEVRQKGLDKFGRIIEEFLDSKGRSIIYDDMGQVIKHGKGRFTWDPWGRLIAVKSDTYEWSASYDALGRRLQTNYTPINKGVMWNSKEKTVVTTSYFDPENEFQEIGVRGDKRTFWKFYGATSCDAMMNSKGEVAILHHDLRNNLIAVVTAETTHWNKDYPTPYGPRGPPKEENNDVISFAISHTWQDMRIDPTGLICLGVRYYDPKDGRFLSPDPICHPSCLDLYAYANGDPINNRDLDGRFASAAYDTVRGVTIKDIAQITLHPLFQLQQAIWPNNPSQRYNLSEFGRSELPYSLYVTFNNGMDNTFEEAQKGALYLSDLCYNCNVHAVYGATRGFGNDIIWAIMAYVGVETDPVALLQDEWKAIFDRDQDAMIFHITHSRGVIESAQALLRMPEELRRRIQVVGIAPAGYVDRHTCLAVTHYCSRDFVPLFDVFGARRERTTIINLQPDPEAPWQDHRLQSITYKKNIEDVFADFFKKNGY